VTTDFVALAEALAVAGGSKAGAVDLAVRILVSGRAALSGPRDDRERLVLDRAVRAGVLNPDGTPNIGPAAELVRVCDLLSKVAPAAAAPGPEPDLVFTAPPGVPVEPDVRLDLLVADVIRMATQSLHIGGPFWNLAGLALLDPVVLPAVERGVEVDLWFHTSEDDHVEVPLEWSTRLARSGTVRAHWYQSDGLSLMHAKFVVADQRRGYLGTANLTSLGMSAHVEIGTELTQRQSTQLVTFLELLDAQDRFLRSPQAPR
jgi:phosphatidylserine/phosphatidylglycerophosphate/cardiolipin synthase-like enzyme